MHAQKLLEKAQDAVARRGWDAAIEFFLQALSLDPDLGEARLGLRKAELEKYSAYYPGAISRLFGTLGDRVTAFFLGLFKRHEKLMATCEKVLLKDPKNGAMGLVLARAAEMAGHKNAALAAYQGVLLVDEDNLEARKGEGRTLAATGKPREALAAYEKAIKLDPRDQEASRARKDLAATVSISATGIDRAQHSRDVLRDRDQTSKLDEAARVVRGEEDLRVSVKQVEDQIAANPNDPKLLAEAGARYASLKEYDRAIEAYERAYGLQPTNYMLREKAGDLKIARFDRRVREAEASGKAEEIEELKLKRLEFQVTEYRERVQEHPTDLDLHFHLGRALFAFGDVDGAIAEFQQTIRDPRRKIESLTMLGNCFLRKGDHDLAENQLRKALEETTGMGERTRDILYGLGRLFEQQDKHAEALAEFKKIYEVDIHYRDVSARMNSLKKKLAGH
ncbi:MAG: tetratricopeptide repeat protein [Planctomycetes bacterium]|jgi:tetratricopeptide (TPR) repeat protein|nr:tetratricopeptide repeat protein [Planctomycetota bacterium]